MGNLGARTIAAIIAGVVLLIVLASALFTVSETEQALVLRFGQIQDAKNEEGLHAKAPFIDNVVYLDKRILSLDLPPQEVIAAGQERLVVDAFARYRIVDPIQFYQAVGTEEVAASRLGTILNSAVRRVLGRSSFEDIVRDDRDTLMTLIQEQVAPEARDRFGLEVVDVRLRRADLPQQNSQRVFDRMRAQRVQEATQIRARGDEAARRIRASSEREATVIVADAERDSQRLRGEGDATRNAIFAEAFSQDPDFFAFYRSMQAYENALRGQGTRMVLSPDSDFFRYFNDLNGGYTRTTRNAAPGGPSIPTIVGGSRERGANRSVGASAETIIEAGGVAGDDEAAPEVEVPEPTVAPIVEPTEPSGAASAGDLATDPIAVEPIVVEPIAPAVSTTPESVTTIEVPLSPGGGTDVSPAPAGAGGGATPPAPTGQ